MNTPKKPPSAFREYVPSVRPLASPSKRIPPVPPPPAGDPSPATWADAPTFAIHDDGLRLEGARPGFERMLRELRRGDVPVVDRIDLHGLTTDEARAALYGFFQRGRRPYRRAVLVVHGKGIHSPGGRGILRDEMAAWLGAPPLSRQVLCFSTARPEDGGAGALYVLLAPRRD